MILAIDQLNAQILVLLEVYYIPLHVSSTVMLTIRRSNYIIQYLVSSQVWWYQMLYNTIWPPDDEHNSACNM